MGQGFLFAGYFQGFGVWVYVGNGCMLAQSGQRIFSLSCWQSAGLQPLHHAAFRYHSILLYPTVPLYKTTTLALHEAGVVVFCGFAERIIRKASPIRRQAPFKTVWKRVCFVPGHRSGTFKPQPIKPDFEPACNRSGPQAGNLLKRLEPCRRLGLGKTTAVCGTR